MWYPCNGTRLFTALSLKGARSSSSIIMYAVP